MPANNENATIKAKALNKIRLCLSSLLALKKGTNVLQILDTQKNVKLELTTIKNS